MTDEVQKIREEVVEIINSINLFTPDEDGKNSSYEEGKLDVASKILQIIDSMQEEPVSEDFKEFEAEYIEREKDNIVCVYDRHVGLVDGAQWQKQQLMANTADVMIRLPYENKDGGYTQLVDTSRPLPVGNNKIAIIFKED